MNKTQWYIGTPAGVVLCIDGSNEGDLSGKFYHSYTERAVPFAGVGQMVLRMEMLYDYLRFPYPGTNTRTFGEEKKLTRLTEERKKKMSDDALLSKHGDIGTFIVRVQHRQNSSWQGRITWMEQDKTIQFRSVWEMIKLIESAVDMVSEQDNRPEELWFGEQK
ncbi:MAG: hypothetical protein IJP64_04640 [Oscillospiraceae bacterium]|nr:hypothetical protein [Oscillospiraceae bacterium]